MSNKQTTRTVRSLFSIEPEKLETPEATQEIADRKLEAKRVVDRLTNIVAEHQRASQPLGASIESSELKIVTTALRDHALGGSGELTLEGCDEILSHCLTRLFEELVEEPSNILYATPTGPDSNRYDAMDISFWIDCLDLLAKRSMPITVK